MAELSGWITDIQRFSLYDGPGIRTTIFLKGCPLHCEWCHNPECIAPAPQLRYWESRCVGCGRCAAVCPQGVHALDASRWHTLRREECWLCGACAEACPVEALRLVGKRITVTEAMKPVLTDQRYYATSGGGLTVSGGEPFLQPDFLEALLRAAKDAGVCAAVETSGSMPMALYRRMLPLINLFLYDYKETDPAQHFAYTGRDNRDILANLDWLMLNGARVLLRCPIIPGRNDREEHLLGIAALLRRYPGLVGCELMAYHKLGACKYKELGLPYALEAEEMSAEYKEALLKRLNAYAPREIAWG